MIPFKIMMIKTSCGHVSSSGNKSREQTPQLKARVFILLLLKMWQGAAVL